MSYRQANYIYKREIKLREQKRVLWQLDLAEAINIAYIGSQPAQKGKTNKNSKNYSKWRRKKYNQIFPEINKNTIWENLKRSKRL